MDIVQACHDPNLFKPWFHRRDDWTAWITFLKTLFALPMTSAELRIFRECTARHVPPTKSATEAYIVCGRRGGKSRTLALIAVYIACFNDFRKYLAPGERATIPIVASDRKQARIIVRYIRSLLRDVPMLREMIESERSEGFDLANSVTIEVCTCNYSAPRGYAIPVALCDEVAYWSDENSSQPDVEVIAALRPGQLQFPAPLLLVASSPYAKRGLLWDQYQRHFGKEHDGIVVWQASSRVMNPSIQQAFIEREIEADPARATAEYLALFRNDISGFLTHEALSAVISKGVYERSPQRNVRYTGFVDPSGGSSDSMTLAISHVANDIAVLDCVREVRPPFSPERVVSEFAETLEAYGIAEVHGDRYAGEFPRELFRKQNIKYLLSDKSKSEIYLSLLPMINSGTVALLDNKRVINQLLGLERRTARGGRDSVDHSPSAAHDDLANSAAGALVNAARPKQATREYAIDIHGNLHPIGQSNGDFNSELARKGLKSRDALAGGSQFRDYDE